MDAGVKRKGRLRSHRSRAHHVLSGFSFNFNFSFSCITRRLVYFHFNEQIYLYTASVSFCSNHWNRQKPFFFKVVPIQKTLPERHARTYMPRKNPVLSAEEADLLASCWTNDPTDE
jgi:hypothetical protein